MRFKRLLALLLAAALALSLLVGCGGRNQSLSQMLLNLLDGQYQNVSVEIDSDLEAKLRQAISQSETDEELQAALEQLLGGGISFQRLGSGQQGDTAWTLIIYPGTDPDAAARSVYLDLDKVFAALPADGVYSSGFAMAEMENGYAILVRATVDKAGTEDKPDPVTLESIAVTTPPTKTTYWVGESFDPAGMEITATYSNGTTKTLKDIKQNGDQGVKWTPDGALTTVGTQDITITYGDQTTTVTVTVKEPEVDELKVEPSSLTYTAGDYFNYGAGKNITVTAGYTYGEDKVINIKDCDLTITPPNGDTPETVDKDYRFMTEGSYPLTVSFGGKDAQVNIEVNPATLTGIEVTTLPTRTTYFDGESFDPAGMIVSEVYSNGTKTAVTNYTYSPGPLTKDNNVVTISYGGESTTVEVTILGENNSYDADTKTYSIATAEGLQAWNQAALNDLSINCTLTSNIDLTGEWTPIGTESQPYTGTFDGNNHTITGLKIDQSGTDYVGLIGHLGSGGKVQDVTLTNINVSGANCVGGIAGQNYGTVENCSVNGTVTGKGFTDTGGIAGSNYGTISGCSAEGTVTGSVNVGGIAGGSYLGVTIEGCHSTAAVSGISSVGGVLGNLGNNSFLMACYSTGNVTATITYGYAHVGGVVGINGQGTVTACYHATGEITSSVGDRIGGIAGCNDQGTFTACYWENNQGQGTGSGSTGGTTLVTGGWTEDIITAMNTALGGAGWRYKLTGGLPTLKKTNP